MARALRNKPLIEAFMEVHFDPTSAVASYPIWVGVLYEHLKDRFPHTVTLPASTLPTQMAPELARLQFRPGEDGWPLIQVGPAVVTLNFNEGYRWSEFRAMAARLFTELSVGHGSDSMPISSLALSYQNVIHLDLQERLREVLERKLNTRFDLPETILNDARLTPERSGFNYFLSRSVGDPAGDASIRFASAEHKKVPAIICELRFVSTNANVLASLDSRNAWLVGAHELLEAWFFAVIQGELEREFEPYDDAESA